MCGLMEAGTDESVGALRADGGGTGAIGHPACRPDQGAECT